MSSTVIAPPADVPWGAAPSATADVPKRRLHALWHGRTEDAAWVRPAVLSLLVLTAVLYLWGLGASGWANDYYSAAVQAGTKSWKAFLFGSTDASNFITVDKSPASLWPMEISARILGVNSWSILVPQALMGVATVGVVYATIRRWFTAAAGLIAGAVVAFTPVAALMFRYNNPDAMLVLLLTIGAYVMTRRVGGRAHALARHCGSIGRVRVPGERASGLPRASRVRARVPDLWSAADRASASTALRVRHRDAPGGRMVGRVRSNSGPRRTVRTSAVHRTTRS